MQGEFNGDFTRDTHHPLKRFSRVLMQQGRVLLDADWNEQTSIVLHYLRSLAADLIGPYGGPGDGFKIAGFTADDTGRLKEDFTIEQGHYYVQGILCENDAKIANHLHQGISFEAFKPLTAGTYLIYLDVWERHITFLADEDPLRNEPGIREVALGGPDTASRAKVVWQVRWVKPEVTKGNPGVKTAVTALDLNKLDDNAGYELFQDILKENSVISSTPGKLRARAMKPKTNDHDCACVTSPESRYRGLENQLYRVEVHQAGPAWNGIAPSSKPDPNPLKQSNLAEAATFKWSRENGSVVFRIRKPIEIGDDRTAVALSDLGRDDRFGLKEGHWVEIVDDDYILQNRAEPLLEVLEINAEKRSVILRGKPGPNVGVDPKKHPLLRRWEYRGDPRNGGLTSIQASEESWLPLEDGIEIQFQAPAATRFKTGDYWLIPARIATGDVEWPGPVGEPDPLPPHGIEHHYAPLQIVTVGADAKVMATLPNDCRRKIQ